ncbi:sphingosine N-acyltransferase lag1 [Rhodotorula toruloides]
MAGRKRSNSVKEALKQLEPTSPPGATTNKPAWTQPTGPLAWFVKPKKTGQLVAVVVAIWAAIERFAPARQNPLTPFLFISYPLAREPGDEGQRYGKGPWDLAFLAFYIVVFSFLRQSVTEFFIRPFAMRLGLKTEGKITRFMEQAYAVVYFSASGAYGLYVMQRQESWWYHTEHFWLEYPHWRMDGALKSYYLLQFSYWLQQMIVLVLGLEKPRSDFMELVIHHIVTLWLVGWSYMINLTMIGTAIFVSMDLPDICLAVSKCLNYLDLQRTSEVSFVFFLVVWHYMRHYLNLRILWSVWNEYDLIPEQWRSWTSPKGWWVFYGFGSGAIPAWMKYQIFAPILALQLVNTFWSYLIWRILFRMISGQKAADVREEGEDEEEEQQVQAVKPESKKKR